MPEFCKAPRTRVTMVTTTLSRAMKGDKGRISKGDAYTRND